MSLLQYKIPLLLLFILGAISGHILFSSSAPLELKGFVVVFDLLVTWVINEYTLAMDQLEEEAWKRRVFSKENRG